MTEMTIHRALTTLKSLDGRINKAISDGIFVIPRKQSEKTVQGMSIEDINSAIQSSKDKVEALISQREEIKAAVVLSNATTLVKVGEHEMTVAAAIERKSSIEYKKSYLRELTRQYNQSVVRVTHQNDALPDKLESYLANVLGSKEERKSEEVEAYTDKFMERNRFELIDPLEIRNTIEKLSDEIDEFEVNVDAVLSESNATTIIKIQD